VETFCYLSSRVISFAGCGLVIGGIAEHKPWAVITNQLVCMCRLKTAVSQCNSGDLSWGSTKLDDC
jgi:hypothetical protein